MFLNRQLLISSKRRILPELNYEFEQRINPFYVDAVLRSSPKLSHFV
jgi:hypothetical protein